MPNSKPLQPLVLDALGVSGLNTQSNSTALDYNWLTLADNTMLDTDGRLTSRHGFKQISTGLSDATGSTNNTKILKSIGERVKVDGTVEYFGGMGNSIYKIDTAATPNTFTAQVFDSTPQTITDGNWQFVNFNGKLFGVQRGHVIISMGQDGETWEDLEDCSGFQSPLPAPTNFKPSCALGDFGSLWVGGITDNKNIVYRSDNLQAQKWGSGTAGQIDLQTVWGNDEVVALASFLNRLVIFGKRNIAIYANPWDAGVNQSTFQLQDLIKGVGCVARDSVQSYGDDVIFLSSTGVRSLARTTEKENLPLTDLTKNVKNDVNRLVPTTDADADKVKSIYDARGGVYILHIGHKDRTYAVDFKNVNNDGSPVITTWVLPKSKKPTAFLSTLIGDFWMGNGSANLTGEEIAGSISKYVDYTDKTLADVTATYGTQSTCEAAGNTWETTNSECWASTSNDYTTKFKTVWMDFGVSGVAKLLKRITAVVTGGKNAVMSIKWFRDYEVTGTGTSVSLRPVTTGTPSLWGAATSLYGTTKFAPTYSSREYKIPMSRSAKTLQLEVETTVVGEKAAIQDITILAKTGKVR